MKLICSPDENSLPPISTTTLPVLLFGRSDGVRSVSVGAKVNEELLRRGFSLEPMVRDLLSLALSVIAADTAVLKPKSADGWTREIELVVAVSQPDHWNAQSPLIERMLRFLTTDIWQVKFVPCNFEYKAPKSPKLSPSSVIALLSGGVDSLIGVLDLAAKEIKPLVVSQVVTGDAENQTKFATEISGGLEHLQLNHSVHWTAANDLNQRARSFIFLAYGTLAASCVEAYRDGATIPLFVSENGLISINPPLTAARVGSLSTRTTHPVFIALVQKLLDESGLRVKLMNPYQFKTKGEMMAECQNQEYLKANAHSATSCGRFRRNGLKHCGRCVPCLIRRAAFHRWPFADQTVYKFDNLGINDSSHSGFDDVRSASMAIAVARESGINAVLGASLASPLVSESASYRGVAERGLAELEAFLRHAGVK